MTDSPTLPPAADRRRKGRLIRLAKYAVLALVLGCVVWAMYREFSKVTRADLEQLHPNGWFVAASALCMVGINSVQMIRYRSLLVAYGARPTWPQMATIAWIPPLGKYVPGSVWALGAAIGMLRRFGINVVVAVSVVLMVDAFSEIVGLLIAVPLLSREPLASEFPAGRWLAPLALAAGCVAMAPPIFNRLLALALRLFKRPPLDHLPTWGEYVVPVLTAIAQWLFAGGALWCMTRAITPIAPGLYVQMTMVAAAALAVGYLFFIAPAGAGLREGIFLLLLPPLLRDAPTGTVVCVTLAMRVVQIVVELALAGVGGLILRRENREGVVDTASEGGNTNRTNLTKEHELG